MSEADSKLADVVPKDSNKFSEKSVSLYLTKRKENKSGRSYKTKWNFRHEKAPTSGLWKKTKTIILHQSNPLSSQVLWSFFYTVAADFDINS
jgi:hypothetical protein